MKFLRFKKGSTEQAQIGILTPEGIIPLAAVLPDAPACMIEFMRSALWQEAAKLEIPADAPRLPKEAVEFLPPIARPGKIICVGLNYREHVLEGGREIPDYPTVFLKASSSIIAHQQAIHLPAVSQMVDFEAELAVVIGRETINCSAEQAEDYIAGYTILNDVSARDYQRRTSQWTMGKSCDTFGPMGPVLVTWDEIPDAHALTISSTLNGYEMQRSNTSNLIFGIPFLIEYVSSVMTLEAGDILSTGTPSGVGCFREPPIFLKSGDTVEITIESIGTLTNPVH